MANGDGGGTTARGRSPRPIPLSEHKISGHKSSTIRPPLVALVPVLHRGWYLVHEIDHVGETEVGRQRSVPRSEDGTGRMERAVLPPRPCRLLDALDPYLIFLCWPTERNFPFLLSPPPPPPFLDQDPASVSVKNRRSPQRGDASGANAASVRVESQSRAIRYTPLRRQLRTMHRATQGKRENVDDTR